jgi:tetratricopeptide (TPR) repeat protein
MTIVRNGTSRDIAVTRGRTASIAAGDVAGPLANSINSFGGSRAKYRKPQASIYVRLVLRRIGFYALSPEQTRPRLSAIRRSLTVDPKIGRYHSLVALVLYNGVNTKADISAYAEAEAEAKLALELDPKDAWHHNMMGLVLLAKKQWAAAEADFTEAVRLAPDSAEYKTNIGKAQKHQRY